MIFKQKTHRQRRAAATPEPTLSPRLAALVRESWWLLVVAIFAYLALILATYQRSDPGWSFSGSGTAIHNKGGAVGAWLADLLLYLFGVSAWWWVFAGIVLVVTGYRHLTRSIEAADRHHPWLAVPGFALVLLSSAALEALRLYRLPAALPHSPGGALGEVIGSGFSRALGFNGGTLLLIALFAIGWSLFTGMSWLRLMERVGGGIERLIARLRQRRDARRDREIGAVALEEREQFVEAARESVEDREPVVVVPAMVDVPRSERVIKEKQKPLFQDMPDSPLPPLALLEDAPSAQEQISPETLEFTSRLIERKLADFGVSVKVLAAYPGPVITRFEIEPAIGVKGAQIVNLMKDLARALSVVSIRVVETIPGKSFMGLELPNAKRQIVRLVELLSSTTYNDTASPLSLALGKDIAGKPVIVDLARMPHLLVAGTTGSGKSVAVNAMILSLLYKAEPRQVRLILIDPKMLELSVYEGIPHLLAPVVTDMKLAANALHWCVGEMERRYRLMSTLGVRNLSGYNARVSEAKKAGQPLTNPFSLTPESPEPIEEMPLIVVVIDELADLMMVTGKKIEELIARIAQKARAAGIHLILAT
ncbi:MAG TPA: DNA translocase FtsK 4TM domain-containing protein, partial [Casimicrobiaceae bacterium]|nr:DNA translocase FtsK 4TM domain-containing protein [Casimicrobiaceae bacterium]